MKDWSDRRVLILGAARQGMALARFLSARGARVILNDSRSEEELGEVRKALADVPLTWALGGHPLRLLEDVQTVYLSGGVLDGDVLH
jgi:UDP-N-acetylmuramoylalanine--D-glutamate ligase